MTDGEKRVFITDDGRGMTKRTLYECFHAKVQNGRIICDKGHLLPNRTLRPLERGAPLAYKICQNCKDFSRMGKQLVASDRGWR
jgi:hypothetical protein